MGVVLASKSYPSVAPADWTITVAHLDAGSSILINSTDRLRTRQLADACRIEHTYPGSSPAGSTIIRLVRTDGGFFQLQDRVIGALGIDCGDLNELGQYRQWDVRLRGFIGVSTLMWTSATVRLTPLSQDTGLKLASLVRLGETGWNVQRVDIEFKPVLTGGTAFTNILDIGGLWLSPFWESAWPIGADWKEPMPEDGVQGYSRGRQAYGDSEAVYRRLEFSLRRMSEASKEALKTAIIGVGVTNPLIFGTRLPGVFTFQTSPGFLYGSLQQAPVIGRQSGTLYKADGLVLAEEF